MLLRDDEHEVPLGWRARFVQIVKAFLRDDVELSDHPVSRVEPVELKTAESIVNNINAYDAPLASLNAATWERSVYRWMDGYWLFLVDLTTVYEKVSDLTLHAQLRDAPEARLEVQSVHIP
ncbi:hypothetical protein QE363_003622 [Sphingomonas sp. SORGH_AS870]|uniref:DUF7668 domain-containing protein n=1 Tax=Sphingomonas sp. SORGH_AS_0870 TaxID=3041801 RepID=UPI00285DDE73|nr:hypothetical protein [Sphingomonas sp. SORGH_AS_0870]MDR6147829.1 hypothetical protein [Sphingomonas sp. SORGH_AS_0870]